MFKRAKRSLPALDWFKDDIIVDSLTDEGDFELVPGTEVDVQALYEVMKTSAEDPSLTLRQGCLSYRHRGREDDVRVRDREARLSNTTDVLLTPRSVHVHVSNTDFHAKWTRVLNELTRILTTAEQITCVQTNDGPALEACVKSLWGPDVRLLAQHADISVAVVFCRNEKLMVQLLLL